ncbi:hypothetical protein EJB05_32699, partial [Eragrostis curvula]
MAINLLLLQSCSDPDTNTLLDQSRTQLVDFQPPPRPLLTEHEDLVRLIAERVLAGEFKDYVRLRAVCTRWRRITDCPRGRSVVDPRFHPRHWMMLPEGHRLYPGHTRLRGLVRFFNLRTGALATLRLPLFKRHFAMDSVDGLLLLQRDHDMAVRLLHPFTGDVVDLPSLATLRPQLTPLFHPVQERAFMQEIEFLQIMRQVCAAVSFSPDNGVVTAMLAFKSDRVPRVAFATSEDQQWTLSSWETQRPMAQILSHQGKIYFLKACRIWMLDPPQRLRVRSHEEDKTSSLLVLLPPKLIATCPYAEVGPPIYMAECESEILLVARTKDSRFEVRVHRLADLILGRSVPLNSIGGNSLFLWQRGVCVSSKAHPTIAADSVVMMHPSFDYLGQYHLASGTWSMATDGNFLKGPVPSPYTLIHHIYTCCDRFYWNKGEMYCRARYPTWGAKSKWRRLKDSVFHYIVSGRMRRDKYHDDGLDVVRFEPEPGLLIHLVDIKQHVHEIPVIIVGVPAVENLITASN